MAQRQCGAIALSADGPVCTRQAGHAGPHVASAIGLDGAPIEVWRWGQDAPPLLDTSYAGLVREALGERKLFGEWAKWHALVDAAVQARAGVSLADLPDVPLRDWYDAGVLPHVAAEDALREAGWGEGDEDETFDERVRG